MDAEHLTSLLAPNHQRTLVKQLGQLNEAQRKKLAPVVRKAAEWGASQQHDAVSLALAVLGTLGGARQAASALPWGAERSDQEFVSLAIQVLRDRAPHWLPMLPQALLREASGVWWQLVRALVREGLATRPEEPEYFTSMPYGAAPLNRPVVESLRQDAGLLDVELWLLLGTEGAGRRLAQHDSWLDKPHQYPLGPEPVPRPEDTWRMALVTLAETGEIDRERVLDAVLAAPLRDWAPVDLAWFVGLHEALEPTLDEVGTRQGTYARLLTVEHGPSVRLAQRQLTRLLADPRLEPAPLLVASGSTLGRSDKASVSAQLRLLSALATARPDADVTDVVRVAFEHPRADVRDQAGKLLKKLGADDRHSVPLLAPAFVAPEQVPRPSPERVVSVADEDELADLILRLLEEADDPIEVERALDGLLRFADRSPAAADVLLRRADEVEYYVDDPRFALVTLARAWLIPRPRFRRERWAIHLAHAHFGQRPADPLSFYGVAGRRLSDIATAIRTGPTIGLALPTFTDGTIDAADLAERLASIGGHDEPPAYEAGLAVLRVAPARLGELAGHGVGTTGRVVGHAIRRVQDRAHRWERETRSLPTRWEWQEPVRLTLFHDRTSLSGADTPVDALLALADRWERASAEYEFGEYAARFEQTIAFCSLMVPHHLDVLAAHVHPQLVRDLAKERGVTAPVLDALARSSCRLREPGSSALVLGLAAKDARIRTAAQDALVDLARYGLLDGVMLGQQASAHLADDLVVGKRVSTGLTEVSRADDAAVLPVLAALEALLPALPGRRDAGAFLELAADLAERTSRRVSLPAEFEAMARGKSASMVARSARRLVR